jgi:DNA-binding NtrC family response regulator
MRIETDVKAKLERVGFTVIRNGWPDILVKDQDGGLYFIELKASNDKIRPEQKRLLQVLAQYGLSVFVVSYNKKLEKSWNKLKSINDDNIVTGEGLEEYLARVEKAIIEKTLKENRLSPSRTAKALKITKRQLRYKIEKYSITRK